MLKVEIVNEYVRIGGRVEKGEVEGCDKGEGGWEVVFIEGGK